MSSVATVLMALMCLVASSMPRRHLIESVTKLLEKNLQLLLDCFSPGIGIKNPQFSEIKLFHRISQFPMELDKVVFYHPYFSLSILMNY